MRGNTHFFNWIINKFKEGATEYLLEIWVAEFVLAIPTAMFNLASQPFKEDYHLFLVILNLMVGVYSLYSVASLFYWVGTKLRRFLNCLDENISKIRYKYRYFIRKVQRKL